MSNFEPLLTAKLARDVYALTENDSIEKAIAILNQNYQGQFTFCAETNMLVGRTGGPAFIKCPTAFGFGLIGQGPMQGHGVFVFRGIEYLADWLSNLNISTSRSRSGLSLHDGFAKAFNSMEPQLEAMLQAMSNANIVNLHCIGRSLTGWCFTNISP